MAIRTVKARIFGRVQGVFFRHHTKLKADSLGLGGWVKNRSDGSVEALITGSDERVAEMVQWLQHGPDSAIVTKLEIADLESVEQTYRSFEVAY